MVVVDQFPQLSETFVSRQVETLRADVVARRINTPLPADKPGKFRVLSLENGSAGITLKLHTYALKVGSRLLGTPTYYWHPLQHRLFEKHLRQLQPAVVLAQFGTSGINCYPVCRKLGIPLVIHFHGYDASQLLQNKHYVRNLRELRAYVSGVVVVNEDMVGELTRIGFGPEKIFNIPYGVPIEDFRPAPKAFGPVFRFLMVGRLVPKKSPLNALKAFEQCADHNDTVELTVIGDGPLFEETARYVQHSRHKEKINMRGAQPQAVVKELLGKAHVFIQHSVTAASKDTEGWPVAIAEACASGLPVVSTLHAGIKRQIVHGETGFLVPEGDFHAMGRYMLELSRDAAMCERMGRLGRQHMEKNGNFEIQAGRLAAVLMRAAGQPRTPEEGH